MTILDPNANVLRHAAGRLRHLDVTSVQADVLKPLPTPGPFESAALSLVLHCLPGPMERKAVAVANVARVMAPGGVVFGASVLGTSARHTRLGRGFLWAFNKRGAFDNLDDTEAGLREILERSFRDVQLETIAGTAVFVATALSEDFRRHARQERTHWRGVGRLGAWALAATGAAGATAALTVGTSVLGPFGLAVIFGAIHIVGGAKGDSADNKV